MAHKMLGVLEANGATHAMVVYGHDGLDELTTTTTSTMVELVGGAVRSVEVDPRGLGLEPATPDDLHGGDAETNAELTRRVLGGQKGPHRDVVALNAAAGILAAGLVADLEEGLGAAERSLDEGRAADVLERLVKTSQEVAA
jgi:anthranilate phosphoribosyltransferase